MLIKIVINWNKVNSIKQSIIKHLVVKRAYLGYTKWLSIEEIEPSTYKEFKELEDYKIFIAFKQYLHYFKSQNFITAKITFLNIIGIYHKK